MATIEQPLRTEAQLWAAVDGLRNNMDAAQYKRLVLGLILSKYMSDALRDSRLTKLISGELRANDAKASTQGATS